MYLTKEMMTSAIKNIQNFNDDITKLYNSHGMSLSENIGRRNCMLSQAQEHFIAEELRNTFASVITDGAPGKPDIFIEDIHTELECKLTTRNVSGGINLQIDYETLKQKGSLDCMYLVASKDFNSFSALLFKGLTIEDFAPPANGSRGRARMIKWRSMKKCEVLVGDVENQKKININKIDTQLSNAKLKVNKITGKPTAPKKIEALISRKKFWVESPNRYKIVLAAI